MKDVKFIRINEDNINFIPDIIKIDDKDIQKKYRFKIDMSQQH